MCVGRGKGEEIYSNYRTTADYISRDKKAVVNYANNSNSFSKIVL